MNNVIQNAKTRFVKENYIELSPIYLTENKWALVHLVSVEDLKSRGYHMLSNSLKVHEKSALMANSGEWLEIKFSYYPKNHNQNYTGKDEIGIKINVNKSQEYTSDSVLMVSVCDRWSLDNVGDHNFNMDEILDKISPKIMELIHS